MATTTGNTITNIIVMNAIKTMHPPVFDALQVAFAMGFRNLTTHHSEYRAILRVLTRLEKGGELGRIYYPTIGHTIFYCRDRVLRQPM